MSNELLDSRILQLRNNPRDLPFLHQLLPTLKSSILLFRASEHNFRSAAFHRLCDNRPDTLLLLTTEFGKTLGGFTHYPWTSHDGTYVHD